ncbi:MAG: hypothetical protein ACE5HI_01345 [bacterium]
MYFDSEQNVIDETSKTRIILGEAFTMISATEATAQVFWTAFQAMPQKEREAIVTRFLTEKDFMVLCVLKAGLLLACTV